MAKYCKNCGKELEEGAIFCDNCGTKIDDSKSNTKSSTADNINKSFNKFNDSIDNFSNNFSDSFSDLFDIYNINMMDDEVVIKRSKIHPGSLYFPIFFVVITFILMFLTFFILTPLFIIALVWLIIRFISYSSTDLILTNKRVFGKTGLISTTQMQSPLNMINSVAFNNGIFGKLLGYGTVQILTASTIYKFRYITDGQTLYSDIFNQLERTNKEKLQEQAEAIAKAIAKSGAQVKVANFNPGTFVNTIKANGCLDGNNLVSACALKSVLVNDYERKSSALSGSLENKANVIAGYINNGYEVILRVKSPDPRQHWVLVTGVSGSTIYMSDTASDANIVVPFYNANEVVYMIAYRFDI